MTDDCTCSVCEELEQLAERRSNLLYPPMNPGIADHPERRLEQVVAINRGIARLELLGCQTPRAEDTTRSVSSAGGAASGAEGRPRPAPPLLVEVH